METKKYTIFNDNFVKVWQRKDREEFRSSNALPIYASKAIFERRLLQEKILICVAETGSGKSTQLPQYMAEMFDNNPGMIVVTQPRALAAISVAKRVGYEFDGPEIGDVGHSVGYKAGSSQVISKNTKIMFMTDAQFINEMIKNDQVPHVRAILIDEAHERSVNTDIVLGIAKHLMAKRNDDFYVVIASATIDPKPFLQFFNNTHNDALKVPGRIFEVQVHYWPDDSEETKSEYVKGISEDYVVNKTLEAMNKFTEGHALVFLPRQKDIENCIESFKAVAPKHFKPLPLFGSLSVEEQMNVIEFDKRKENANERLVAFCTNVAETSLTVQGIKLVIDSGLANEARYDTKRRTTLLEMTWISRSSADQRKGRAGRLSKGDCVRLYSNDKLSRQSIEPEILRASIDLTFLQLKVLRLENLPLISRPDEDKIKTAMDNLRLSGALDQNYNVTNLGKFFSDLPFDPLISSFVSDLYFSHETDIGLLIASLITAPGDIFYLGDKEERKENLQKISKASAEFISDIDFKLDWYRKWLAQERVDQIKFTVDNNLNNRVLKYIKTTFEDNLKKLKHFKSSSKFDSALLFYNHRNSHTKSESEHECLSKALCNWLYEQSCSTVVPKIPQHGMRVITTNELGIIDTNSCIMNKTDRNDKCLFFVSVSSFFRMTREDKSDLIIAKNLHPVNLNHLKQCMDDKWLLRAQIDLDIILVHTEDNIGSYKANSIEEHTGKSYKDIKIFSEFIQSPYSKFISSVFMKNEAVISVFAPRSLENSVKLKALQLFKNLREKLENQESKESFFFLNGTYLASVKNGFMCSNIEAVSDKLKIVVPYLEFKDYSEFKKNFFEKFSVLTTDLADYSYNLKKKEAILLLKKEEVAKEYRKKFLMQGIVLQDAQMNTDVNQNPATRVKFECKSDLNLSKGNLSNILGVFIKDVTDIERKPQYTIRISKLPNNFRLPTFIPKPDSQSELLISNKTFILSGSASIFINYFDEDNFRSAEHKLKRHLRSYETETVNGKIINVTPEIECTRKIVNLKWKAELASVEDAQKIYENKDKLLYYEPKIKAIFFYTEFKKVPVSVYSHEFLNSTKSEIEKIGRNEIECNINATENGFKFYMPNVPPESFQEIKEKLKLKFDPALLTLPSNQDPYRRFYFKNLFQREDFKIEWPKRFNLSIQADEFSARIYGEGINIGAFMKHLGDDFDDFLNRYRLFNLSSTVALLFEKNRVGIAKLEELKSKYQSNGVFFNYEKSNVDLYIEKSSPYKAYLKHIAAEVEALISDLESHSDAVVKDQCVFCGEKENLKLFSLCGHKYCANCVTILAKNSKRFPLTCKKCGTNIKVEDVTTSVTKGDKEQLAKNAITFYLKNESSKFLLCSFECGGIVDASKDFSVCLTCNKAQCVKCGSTNELHMNKTCEQLMQLTKESDCDLGKLINNAQMFVRDNWSSNPNLNPIMDIKHNEYLLEKHSSIRKQFDAALKHLSITDIVKSGLFAFHGTCEEAIIPICEGGFDPMRRSGQAHGRGEYFGISADVSKGYCKLSNLMLICFILNGSFVKKREGFCYVVDNPLDRKMTYSIPVLMVNFASTKNVVFAPLAEIQTKKMVTGDGDPDKLSHNYICLNNF